MISLHMVFSGVISGPNIKQKFQEKIISSKVCMNILLIIAIMYCDLGVSSQKVPWKGEGRG